MPWPAVQINGMLCPGKESAKSTANGAAAKDKNIHKSRSFYFKLLRPGFFCYHTKMLCNPKRKRPQRPHQFIHRIFCNPVKPFSGPNNSLPCFFDPAVGNGLISG